MGPSPGLGGSDRMGVALTPFGRDPPGCPAPMRWLRRHDGVFLGTQVPSLSSRRPRGSKENGPRATRFLTMLTRAIQRLGTDHRGPGSGRGGCDRDEIRGVVIDPRGVPSAEESPSPTVRVRQPGRDGAGLRSSSRSIRGPGEVTAGVFHQAGFSSEVFHQTGVFQQSQSIGHDTSAGSERTKPTRPDRPVAAPRTKWAMWELTKRGF